MLPRKELKNLIRARLQPAISPRELDNLIADVDKLSDAWEEMNPSHLDGESCSVVNCIDCWLEEQLDRGVDVKILLKRPRRPKRASAALRHAPGPEK
jgi:hypothetical protein